MSSDQGPSPALADQAAMQALLAAWTERGWLRPLDTAFARFLCDESPRASPLLVLAAALASHQLGRGHACLDLPATLADPGFALSLPPDGGPTDDAGLATPLPAQVLAGVDLAHWLAALQAPDLIGGGPGSTPLVRIGNRLYLRRYWQAEQDVRRGIEQRLARAEQHRSRFPVSDLRTVLDGLFAGDTSTPEGCHWQKLASAMAARSAFSIITGGPGTGKTTTVVRVLALLQALALMPPADGAPARALRIRLAAPTGKAAARLKRSIADAVATLPLDHLAQGSAVRLAIPTQVTTLHRLLGSRPDTRRFRHDAQAPLALDVLVIDEASMIDLEMMAAVLAALPTGARLILLGDKDQLASVEAGAVLGQLCRRATEGHYTPATAAWLAQASGETLPTALIDPVGSALDQAVAMLRHSHRFSSDSGIGQLAAAVNNGDAVTVGQRLAHAGPGVTPLVICSHGDAAFRQLVIEGGADPAHCGYRRYLERVRTGPTDPHDPAALDVWAASVLAAHGRFQLLCALRRGPWGVTGLNVRIARLLQAEGLIPSTDGWYAGRPVLVTRNDATLGLMNGDIGIALPIPAAGGAASALRVAFLADDPDGGVRWVLPVRLQALETVYALTVHKSQGSEFEHVALVLPDTSSPILTRELIYTGITRARAHLTLIQTGAPAIVEGAVHRRVIRASGLMAD